MPEPKQPAPIRAEPEVIATVQGAEEETPDQWADLVEFVRAAVQREERRQRDGNQKEGLYEDSRGAA